MQASKQALNQGSMLDKYHAKSGLWSRELYAKTRLTTQHPASFVENVLLSKNKQIKKSVGIKSVLADIFILTCVSDVSGRSSCRYRRCKNE